MNADNLKTTSWVRDADVDFAVEATESAKSRIDGIGAIGGCHDHNIWARLETIHQGQQLRHNTTFDFAICLLVVQWRG
jgi:hypothetical protein